MKVNVYTPALVAALVLSAFALQAQENALAFADEATLEMKPANDFSLYADQDPRIFYIDFESISSKIEEVVVKNTKGEAVWSANVFELPSNAIYEMALHQLSPGEYRIELRMFNKTMQHQLRL